MEYVLILGATSDVGMACAEVFAKNGYGLQLASRNVERLANLKADLTIRYKTKIELLPFDALDYNSHQQFYGSILVKPSIVIAMFGYLGDQEVAQKDSAEALKIINSNYTGAVHILTIISNEFAKEGKGGIIGVSSVAGERGRMSNYYYGSAKAGFTSYLSGLRNRLAHKNLHVMTVKPGFMYTKMTEGLPLPAPLTATPAYAAEKIFKGWKNKKNVIYIKPIWRFIMFIIRSIPEFIFKKLKL